MMADDSWERAPQKSFRKADRVCLGNGSGAFTCQGSDPCVPDGGLCGNGERCCSQQCNGANMIVDPYCCDTIDDACSHGVCVVSEDPLAPECSDQSNDMSILRPFGNPGCIASICDQPGLSKCCCNTWDVECRDAAAASDVCGVTCAVQPL